MEHLILPQIHQACKLALPDGLKELMADISREVLRAQPENLCKFIADYLAALLVTREHLTMACLLCGEACEGICQPTLVEELRSQGLKEEAEKAAEIIVAYFEDGGYKEDNVMLKLIKNTKITEQQLPDVRRAIETAFLKQKLKDTLPQQYSSDSVDSITRAVQHTMKLYEKTKPTREEYAAMASKIQAAYKGYGVRRLPASPCRPPPSGFSFPEKHMGYSCHGKNHESSSVTTSNSSSDQRSLQPPFCITDYDDLLEKENNSFDYTLGRDTIDLKKASLLDDKMKKISFGVPAHSNAIEDDDGADESTHSKISNSDFTEDTKIMEDAIADIDDKTVNESVISDNTKRKHCETSKIGHESLTEVKTSKRFVADGGPELGDQVDHCHITMSTTNDDMKSIAKMSINFAAKQNNESIVIDEQSELKKYFNTATLNPQLSQCAGTVDITNQQTLNDDGMPEDKDTEYERAKLVLSNYTNYDYDSIVDSKIKDTVNEDTKTLESTSLSLGDD